MTHEEQIKHLELLFEALQSYKFNAYQVSVRVGARYYNKLEIMEACEALSLTLKKMEKK